ncbi:MAG TPA: hypothetical protein VE132_13320, partial [Micromonosporaceae bacterium]|nr:hypothetical protein [Micromonosporaceae bacterium]
MKPLSAVGEPGRVAARSTADVEDPAGRRQVPSQHRGGHLELDDALVPFEPLPLSIAERGVIAADVCRVHVRLPHPYRPPMLGDGHVPFRSNFRRTRGRWAAMLRTLPRTTRQVGDPLTWVGNRVRRVGGAIVTKRWLRITLVVILC